MKLKKVIITLIIIALIILVILGVLLLYNIHQQENSFTPATENISIEYDNHLKEVEVRNDFYTIKTCVEKFYLYLSKPSDSDYTIIDEEVEQTLEIEERARKQAIYNLLDDKYIQSNGINEENVFNQIPEITLSDVIIENMYVSQQDENMYVYIVSGKLRNQTTKEHTNFTLMLKVDMLNRTFKIVPENYITEYIEQINLGQELVIDMETSIEKNNYNMFDYENISNETYISDMFNEFKENMIYDFELAYQDLNQEYKNKRFGAYEKFQEYAKNNIRNSVIMNLSQYQINEYNDYTQYICVDQNGNYYIFNVTGVMQYSVILDTYTIDLPQFVEQYNNSSDAEKVLLNIQKVFYAINKKDYNYVYSKLDATFKANNFPTEEEFEEYMANTFFEKNSVGYNEYQTRGNLHIYNIVITDDENDNERTIEKEFIMQLKEGTDFVMSFNV